MDKRFWKEASLGTAVFETTEEDHACIRHGNRRPRRSRHLMVTPAGSSTYSRDANHGYPP